MFHHHKNDTAIDRLIADWFPREKMIISESDQMVSITAS